MSEAAAAAPGQVMAVLAASAAFATSATIIALLLTSKAGLATAPLIIVAVVVAYITIQTLTAARGPVTPTAPAAEPQPAAPSHTTPAANPGDGQT